VYIARASKRCVVDTGQWVTVNAPPGEPLIACRAEPVGPEDILAETCSSMQLDADRDNGEGNVSRALFPCPLFGLFPPPCSLPSVFFLSLSLSSDAPSGQ
jgi:hypothetical protein